MIVKLWSNLTKRRRRSFFLLAIFTFIASITEVVSIGAMLPFLGVLTDPEYFYTHALVQPVVQLFHLTDPSQLLLPATAIFIFTILLAAIIRLILLYITTRFSYAAGADLSVDIYRRTLYQEYYVHTASNSSDVINSVIGKTSATVSAIQSYLTFGSSAVLIIFIISTLFIIDYSAALTVSLGFSVLYFLVITFTRKKLGENSRCIAEQSTQVVKALQEGLGGIRDVLIGGTQEFYCKIYRGADIPMRKASGDNVVIGSSPRHVIEAVGMGLIAILAYTMSLEEDGISTAIPILGSLVLGAQRLLPAIQQCYSSYTNIKGTKASIEDVIKILEQPLPNYADQPPLPPIPFREEIRLKNLSFRYSKDTPWVLKDINLRLIKGTTIGFMGVTGSGKSTLVDIIMGLLTATKGELAVDGNRINDKNKNLWQAHIAHVPQNIYLSDSTIEENIAFGVSREQVDHQRVKHAAEKAQISELIEGWIDGYQTFVGERGVRLSGGQRQRIGIARALYQKADVLIFDEATSALDNETEQAVMEAIKRLEEKPTILMIAHRLTTLKECDKVVKLDKDHVFHVGSYQDMINAS
jgi:ATP-binding cassette subfamily B protein